MTKSTPGSRVELSRCLLKRRQWTLIHVYSCQLLYISPQKSIKLSFDWESFFSLEIGGSNLKIASDHTSGRAVHKSSKQNHTQIFIFVDTFFICYFSFQFTIHQFRTAVCVARKREFYRAEVYDKSYLYAVIMGPSLFKFLSSIMSKYQLCVHGNMASL